MGENRKEGVHVEGVLTKIPEVRLGSVVCEDIMGNTQSPLVKKGTKVTRELLQVFNVFQITKAYVTGPAVPSEALDIQKAEHVPVTTLDSFAAVTPFKKRYRSAVMQFKNEFFSWEAGAKISIPTLREIMLPLINDVLHHRVRIFTLNEYSNPLEYIYNHAISTALITAVIAQKMNYSKGEVIQLALASMIADSGMAKIPKKVREKAAALTQQEFQMIKEHPRDSLLMVKDLPLVKTEMKIAIFQHHERLDGSGYPCNSSGNTITVLAHILAVADIFHAMTCERVYKKAASPFNVIEMIQKEKFGKFHIEPVQALLDCVIDVSLGASVILSNHSIGQIVFTNKNNPTRPVVKIAGFDETIDLSKSKDLYIEKILVKD
nr:HD-GYP domain-containing protein [Kurthia huakuii]